MTRPRRGRAAYGRHAGPVAALMAVATAASLWNLRGVIDAGWSTSVPTRLDNRFQAWVIHWGQGALMGEHPLYDASTFAPAHSSLTFSDHLLGLAVVLLPLRWLGLSPAAIFNTATVLGVVAGAAGGYVLGYVLVRRRSAAVVAGAVYAIGPVPWLATMHLNLVWRPGLPIVAALVWVVADRASGRRSWPGLPGDRVLFGALTAVVAWQGLVSFFYTVFVLIVAAVVVAVRWRDLRGGRAGGGRPAGWRSLAGVGAAVAGGTAVTAVTYLPYLVTRREQPGFGWQLEDVAFLRAAPHIVEDANVVWGGRLGRPLFGLDGFHAFPGVVLIALVVASLVLVPSWRRREGSGAVPRLAAALVVVGALGAIGPGWGRTTGWTPFALAFRFVPGFSAIRASGRFVLIVLLGLAAVAAAGVAEVAARLDDRSARVGDRSARLGDRSAGRRWIAAALAAVLVAGLVVEGAARPRDVTPAEPHAVDVVLARDDAPGGVVYLPIGFETLGDFDAQEEFVIRSARHDRRIANGFSGFYPESARVLAGRLTDLTGDEALDCLAAHDLAFVVVSERVGDLGPWAALRNPAAAAPLELVGEFDGELLYRVPPRSVPAGTCPLPAV